MKTDKCIKHFKGIQELQVILIFENETVTENIFAIDNG